MQVLIFNLIFLTEAKEKIKKSSTERPDTECLWVLGESDRHKHLLTNPVIQLFINLKWQKYAPIYSNYQRFLFFYLIILTWYILAMFGGKSKRDLNAIHPFTSELCNVQYEKKDSVIQKFGNTSIYIGFVILVSNFNHESLCNPL